MLIFLLQCFLTGVFSLLDGNQSVHSGFLFYASEIQARFPIFANLRRKILLQTLFSDE